MYAAIEISVDTSVGELRDWLGEKAKTAASNINEEIKETSDDNVDPSEITNQYSFNHAYGDACLKWLTEVCVVLM